MKNSVRRILALLAVAALMMGMFAGSALAEAYVRVEGGDCNVRANPNLNGSYKATMFEGQTASYLGQSSVDDRGVIWYKVNFNGTTGWVSSRYATLVGAGSGYVRADGGDVNVRSNPNLNGVDLATIHDGETASYLGQSSVDGRGVTWYYVNFNGTVGWVSDRYSELVNGNFCVTPNYSASSNYNWVQAVNGDCNIRSIPSLSGSYNGVMYEGDVGEYLGQSSVDDRGVTWYKVEFDGDTGWVSSRYSVIY